MIYYSVTNQEGAVIAGNIHNFPLREKYESTRNFSDFRNGIGAKGAEFETDNIKLWIVAVDDPDLLNSSKLFKKTAGIYLQIANDLWSRTKNKFSAHSHTITTIHTQIKQQLEGYATDDKFHAETYNGSIDNIDNLVRANTHQAAKLVCYVHKRITDMKAHLLGAEVIHSDVSYQVNPVNVSLRRAILNQYSPFAETLEESGIKLDIHFNDSIEVEVDKNMFSLIMYNLFSNAVKYTKPNTEIRLYYDDVNKELNMSMISLKMEKNELTYLTEEGFRGKHADQIAGHGVGLFVVQKALTIMGKKKVFVQPFYENDFSEYGKPYNKNVFRISL